MKLSEAFSGWTTMFVPGEDFPAENKGLFWDGFDFDEDEELAPYESPSPVPQWMENPGQYSAGQIPFQSESSSWSGLAMALKSLAAIIGGSGKAYQHNQYDGKNVLLQPEYSFTFEPGQSGYQEGRL